MNEREKHLMAYRLLGMLIAIGIAFGVLTARGIAGEGDTVGAVHILTPSEFLNLPANVQAVFVGGLIEGMAFVSYGYSLPSHEAWTTCVQQKNIGDTAAEVVAFLKEHPDFDESIASAFAQVIGKRCKH